VGSQQVGAVWQAILQLKTTGERRKHRILLHCNMRLGDNLVNKIIKQTFKLGLKHAL